MPRPLRIEFPGAVYHVTARGNARQDIVTDDRDRRRWLALLERTANVQGWEIFAFALLSNHFHLFFRTPSPNLSRGMQRFLSGYAVGWSRRHRWHRPGHVFQGRFAAQLVEDESYFWAVSRYVHLNPVRAGLVERPGDWAWSSYPGYEQKRRRLPWIAYEELLRSWEGEFGGRDPAAAYRRYVRAGLAGGGDDAVVLPGLNPRRSARGLVIGSPEFLARIKGLMGGDSGSLAELSGKPRRDRARLDRREVYDAVLGHFGVPPEALSRKGDRNEVRAVAAYLARRWTDITLRELAGELGLSRAESVPNLTRRVERQMGGRSRIGKAVSEIERDLESRMKRDPRQTAKTKNKL
jgi:putative transposase